MADGIAVRGFDQRSWPVRAEAGTCPEVRREQDLAALFVSTGGAHDALRRRLPRMASADLAARRTGGYAR